MYSDSASGNQLLKSYRTAKQPAQSSLSPTTAPPSMLSPGAVSPGMVSPGGQKIISVTEERVETIETKPGSKKTRYHVDDISAPEYFTKGTHQQQRLYSRVFFSCVLSSVIDSGEKVEISIDDDEIDSYQLSLKTDRPKDIDWDLNILQKPGKEQKFTKVVEEV